jgi:membrane protein
MHPRIEKIKRHRYVKSTLGFLLLFFNNFQKERIHVTAGYLSYVTLMSLVPLMVVMLSVMTAFPIFSEIRELIENFIYQNFVPASGDVVQEHITGFVSNATKMSAIAITALFILAMLLISAIDQCLNKLWRVNEKRRIITSFSMYWMVLSLGPVLVGSSLVMTSYILSLVSIGDYDLLGLSNIAVQALPLVASIAAFFILYMVVPNKVVPAKFALAGATLAAILFEIAKKAFAIYVTQLPSYEAIYGALSSIPILFLWVYLSWLVVLVGALFTVSLEDYDSETKARSSQQDAD